MSEWVRAWVRVCVCVCVWECVCVGVRTWEEGAKVQAIDTQLHTGIPMLDGL